MFFLVIRVDVSEWTIAVPFKVSDVWTGCKQAVNNVVNIVLNLRIAKV